VLDIQKVPLQGSYSVPTESVWVFYCNVKVDNHGGLGISRSMESRKIPGIEIYWCDGAI
jgi:hypothetical protein